MSETNESEEARSEGRGDGKGCSLAEMDVALRKWMVKEFGPPSSLNEMQRDQWYRDNGLIYHFLRDHFE